MNDLLFRQKVKNSGYKWKFISEKLGISESALIKKRKGLLQYKIGEVNTIVEVLGLTAVERDDIFGLKGTR